MLRLIDEGRRIGQCNVSRLPDTPAGKHITLEKFQQDIQQALEQTKGVRKDAAEMLGISVRTMQRKIKELDEAAVH